MIRFDIESDKVELRNYEYNGKQLQSRSQIAWGFMSDRDGVPHKHPSQVEIRLEDGQTPYPVGTYVLQPQTLYVGKYNKLAVGRVVLSPFKPK